MRKVCCIVLVLLICFGACGCSNKKSEPTETSPVVPSEMPSLSADEYEIVLVDEFNYVHGEIVGKISTNILVLKMDVPRMVNTWGEMVYIIYNQAEQWCVGDEFAVTFSQAQRPYDDTQYVRIIAEEVQPLLLCAKPIIYLYPETATGCSVKLTLNGELTCTYPRYGEDGWKDFTAYPDGTLIFPNGQEYYALYWEGIQKTEWDFSQGFCVTGEDTAQFLEWALAQQGLTRREANEFIVYWLPMMQDNPYNVISFQTDTYTDGAVLDIDPVPDSLLRVFMAYYPTNSEVELEPQSFDTFQREGFTVVEWGGSQAKMP